MEFLESTYTAPTLALLVMVLWTLLVVRTMTQNERGVLTGTALFLAGLFFVGRHPGEGLITLVGVVLWAVGLALFIHAGLSWNTGRDDRTAAWAVLLVLPVVIFGAILTGGVLVTLLAAPAQAAMRMVGR